VNTKPPFAKPGNLLPALACGFVVLAAASPWALGFGTSHAAVANGIAFAMAFGPLALMITALRPASDACIAGGVWLAVSPWVLGYSSAGLAAWGANLLVGAGLAAISWQAGTPRRWMRETPVRAVSRRESSPVQQTRDARHADNHYTVS
jgi:hypothetical protein